MIYVFLRDNLLPFKNSDQSEVEVLDPKEYCYAKCSQTVSAGFQNVIHYAFNYLFMG